MPKSKINVVLEGGGIKGIALVGALEALSHDERFEIAGIGGTSAGAIVATLFAAGVPMSDLKDELYRGFSEFLTTKSRLTQLKNLYFKFGLHETARFRDWIRNLLAKYEVSTFDDVFQAAKVSDLAIVATNVRARQYSVYRPGASSTPDLADAVIRSMSLPFFFVPSFADDSYYVDGGIVSNYPFWLFENSDHPTVGIRLRQQGQSNPPIRSLFAYVVALVETMWLSHDKEQRGKPEYFKTIHVEIPAEISSTDFDIGKVERENLYFRGKDAVREADLVWITRIPRGGISFQEEHSDLLLEEIGRAGQNLYANLRGSKKKEYDYYKVICTVEKDGTQRYFTKAKLKNLDARPLNFLGEGIWPINNEKIGILDMDFQFGRESNASFLPIKSTRQEKLGLILFIPPIPPGESREISWSYKLPAELVEFVRSGKTEEFWVSLESDGVIREMTFDILLNPLLGELVTVDYIGQTSVENRRPLGEIDSPTGYRRYSWRATEIQDRVGEIKLHARLK
ncbi:MAG: patatin-like phospholipase family protein [Nitrospinota bacterium]